jgi:flagellar hook-length control protein FliK
MTPLFVSLTNPASDSIGGLGPGGRLPGPLPPERADVDPAGKRPRSAERSFDEQLDVRLARERNKAPKETGDPTAAGSPTGVGSPVTLTPAEKNVTEEPPAGGALDPTTAGTTPAENVEESPLDPTEAFKSTATTAAEGGRIESPRPPQAEATDESVWKFVVDTPPAEEASETEAPAPEFSEASGAKTSAKPAARPALPGVTPMEKLVDADLETPAPAEAAPVALDPTAGTAGQSEVSDPTFAGESQRISTAAGRIDSGSSTTDASVAARFQRAYEQGDGDATSSEQRQSSDDPSAAAGVSSADDSGTAPADVPPAPAPSQPATVGYDARAAMITTVASAAPGAIAHVLETADSSALVSAETPDPDTADRLVQSLRMQFLRGGGDAVVHIRPEHLGPLTVSVRVEHGSVSAHVTAENAVVAEWLQANEQLLRESLKANGLLLERLVIQRDEPSGGQARRDPHSQRNHRRRDRERQSTFEVTV